MRFWPSGHSGIEVIDPVISNFLAAIVRFHYRRKISRKADPLRSGKGPGFLKGPKAARSHNWAIRTAALDVDGVHHVSALSAGTREIHVALIPDCETDQVRLRCWHLTVGPT